jgi:hypothetical protein
VRLDRVVVRSDGGPGGQGHKQNAERGFTTASMILMVNSTCGLETPEGPDRGTLDQPYVVASQQEERGLMIN